VASSNSLANEDLVNGNELEMVLTCAGETNSMCVVDPSRHHWTFEFKGKEVGMGDRRFSM